MKKLSIAWLIILVFAFNSFAELAIIPLDEAIRDNDLIIVGTLQEITETSENGVTTGKGKIVVNDFIAGNVKTEDERLLKSGDKLQLDYIESFACVMGSHRGIENEKGIFLLKLDENGKIQSKDFRPLNDLKEIRKLLGKGVKPQKAVKIIKLQNEINQPIPENETSTGQTSEVIYCMHSNQPKTENSPFQALLVILGSISFYYLLYRSRFKIR